MKRSTFELNCSLARALEIVGEWWTLLVLRDLFLGVRRFGEIQRRLGISRSMLATRLETLVREGLVEPRTYDEARQRHDYVLTEKGRALWPVLVTLRQWGDEWVSAPDRAPLVMEHVGCGATTVHVACDRCGKPIAADEIRHRPGPGAHSNDRQPAPLPT